MAGITTINEFVNIQLSMNQFNQMDSIVNITRKLVERLQEDRRGTAINFDRADLFRNNRAKAKLIAFKEKIADNVAAAVKAQKAIEWVDKNLLAMKNQLELLLGTTSDESRTATAASFNEHLSELNAKVDGANHTINYRNINLVGNVTSTSFKTDDLYSPTSPGGSYRLIEGTYLGTNYTITDSDGNLWRLNEGDSQYEQIASDGTDVKTGIVLSTEGLTIDSYDATTGDVTFGGSGSLTGTINKGGLGVMKSEFYNDFADDASVQAAIDDINAAIVYAGSKGSSIKANAVLLDGNISLTKLKIEKLERERANIIAEEFDATTAAARAANLKMQLAINNINMLTSASNGLVENMINLVNGPQKAGGLFGMMGF